MVHLGGGAEAHARFKQYEYRANSSLVLTADSHPRDTHEPTGEPESLWGKIDPRSFGEDGEEDESDIDQVQDENGEEDDDGFDAGRSESMQMGGIDDDDIEKANEGLNVQDIDAYWLQRMVKDVYKEIDPQQSQKLAEEVLKILSEGDVGVVENKLVMLLGCDKFGLIKLLVRNILKVVWCTRLARAEDHMERKSIEEEMMDGGPGLVAILEQLHATRATAKERQKNLEKSIREEARRLKDESGDGDRERRVDREGTTTMENCWLKGQCQLLDLDSIAFRQGSLLNSNKKCGLPEGSFRDPRKGYEEIHVPAPKPTLYGLPADIMDTDRTLEERRADLVTAFGI